MTQPMNDTNAPIETPTSPAANGQVELLNTEPALQTEAAAPAPDTSTPTDPAPTTPEADAPMSIDDIEAQVDAKRKEHDLPTLDDTIHSHAPDSGPDLMKPIREAVESGSRYDWHNFLGDIYGVGQAAVYGLGSGLREGTISLEQGASHLGESYMKTILNTFASPEERAKLGNMDQPNAKVEADTKSFEDSIPNIAELLGIPKPDNTVENVVATAAPLIASYWMGGKALEGMGLLTKLHSAEIPGLLGQALGRVGITAPRIGTTISGLLRATASGATVLPKDTGNFADMLDGFKDRPDMVGSASRAWLNNVPGEQWLVHHEGDGPIMSRLKTGLDMAYGELIGPLVLVSMGATKLGLTHALAGTVSPEMLGSAAEAVGHVQKMLGRIGDASSSTEALASLKAEGHAMSDTEAMGNIYPEANNSFQRSATEPIQGKVTRTNAEPIELSAADPAPPDSPDALTSGSTDIPDVTKKGDPAVSGTAPATTGPDAIDPWWEQYRKSGLVDKVKMQLNLDPANLQKRITEAQDAAFEADKSYTDDLLNYKNRFKSFIERTGGVTERAKFDKEAYLTHITEAANGQPGELKKAMGDWSQFMGDGESSPSLLTPKQLRAWDKTPYKVTGDVIDSVKRLTTTNANRKEEAARFLADLMGDSGSPDHMKIAKIMLGETARSSHEVQTAARLGLMNSMYLTNTIMPDLERVASVLRADPTHEGARRVAYQLLEHANQYTEANKNLRSVIGAAQQSAQIDPAIESSLKQVYGPEQYQDYFDPLGANRRVAEREGLSLNADGEIDPLTHLDGEKLPEGADHALALVNRYLGVLEPGAKADWAASMFRTSTHPVWKTIGKSAVFGAQLSEQMLMSAALFHPSTWTRVLTSSFTGITYDSAAQALMAGSALSKQESAALTFGALHRALSTPHSLLVAGKSFIRPGFQDIYSLGTGLYKHAPILGYEMFENSFGKDFATKLFTSAGGVPGRMLRGVGMGLGFPHHVLGSIETMINHGALGSRVSEVLFRDGLSQGMSLREAADHAFTHLNDVMEDTIVAKSVPRGNISLRNTVGLKAEQLRDIASQAEQNAAYTSLRENGKTPGSPFATTKLGDTWPFQLQDGISYLLNHIPVVGPVARGAFAPFMKVSANMLSRTSLPLQVMGEGFGRGLGEMFPKLSGPGGGGEYVSEVLNGLHGPHRKAQLLGHTAISAALMGLGIANTYYTQMSGKTTNYALGQGPMSEATTEGGVKYGESPLPDGGAITTLGETPFVTPYNIGAYGAWINSHYGASSLNPMDASQNAAEGREHMGQLAGVAAPIAPMYQGIIQLFSSLGNNQSGGFGSVRGVLTGTAASAGSMLRRPLRMLDELPGKQVAGKSVPVTNAGVSKAFLTSLGGPASGPNINRVNAYDMSGQNVPDKYDPDNKTNQYLEANGFPVYRPYDDSPLGQYMGALESHGISFPKADPVQNMSVPGSSDPIKVNMQLYYNTKTKEHVWDVYNRFLRDEKVTGAWVGDHKGNEPLGVKEAMSRLAASSLSAEQSSGSRMMRFGTLQQTILSDSADRMNSLLLVARESAKTKTEHYLQIHGDDFINSEGQTLPKYAKMLYDASKPPANKMDAGTNGGGK